MIESVQYNAVLAITGAIHGSSRQLSQELGFESLHDRRWYSKLCFYFKIRDKNCPLYLTELLTAMVNSCYSLCSNCPSKVPKVRTERFKSTFSPSAPLIGTNLTQIYKVIFHFKFLKELYSVLFVLTQNKCTRFTIQKE